MIFGDRYSFRDFLLNNPQYGFEPYGTIAQPQDINAWLQYDCIFRKRFIFYDRKMESSKLEDVEIYAPCSHKNSYSRIIVFDIGYNMFLIMYFHFVCEDNFHDVQYIVVPKNKKWRIK